MAVKVIIFRRVEPLARQVAASLIELFRRTTSSDLRAGRGRRPAFAIAAASVPIGLPTASGPPQLRRSRLDNPLVFAQFAEDGTKLEFNRSTMRVCHSWTSTGSGKAPSAASTPSRAWRRWASRATNLPLGSSVLAALSSRPASSRSPRRLRARLARRINPRARYLLGKRSHASEDNSARNSPSASDSLPLSANDRKKSSLSA